MKKSKIILICMFLIVLSSFVSGRITNGSSTEIISCSVNQCRNPGSIITSSTNNTIAISLSSAIANDGYISTVNLNTADLSITSLDSWEFETTSLTQNNKLLAHHSNNTCYIAGYSGESIDGYISTFIIDENGNIQTSFQDSWEFNPVGTNGVDITYLQDDTYAVIHSNQTNNNWSSIFFVNITSDCNIVKEKVAETPFWSYGGTTVDIFGLHKTGNNIILANTRELNDQNNLTSLTYSTSPYSFTIIDSQAIGERRQASYSRFHNINDTDVVISYIDYSADGELKTIRVENDGTFSTTDTSQITDLASNWAGIASLDNNRSILAFREPTNGVYQIGLYNITDTSTINPPAEDENVTWTSTGIRSRMTHLHNGYFILHETRNDDGVWLTAFNSTFEDVTPPPVVQEKVNTSLLATDINVTSAIISSTAYSDIYEISINTSETNTSIFLMGSFNVVKTTGGGSSDVYINILLNGTSILEEKVRTVSRPPNDEGSTGHSPVFFSVEQGTHNITYQFRRTGSGDVEINDVDLNLGRLETNLLTNVTGDLLDINESFNENTLTPIFNYTETKTQYSKGYHTATLFLETDAITNLTCKIDGSTDSPYFKRTLNPGSTGSAILSFIEDESLDSENMSLNCSNTNGATVNMTGKLLYFSLNDNDNNTIQNGQHSYVGTDTTTVRTLTAGTYNLANLTLLRGNGTGVFFSASASAYTTSGDQTATFFINSTLDDSCYSKKERRFGTDDSLGVAYIYSVCNAQTTAIGDSTEYGLWVTVPAGETLVIADESLSVFETDNLDTTNINLAPTVSITEPANGTIKNTTFNIGWSVFDTSNDRYLVNVTIDNGTVFNILNNSIDTTTSFAYNPIELADGYYNITVTACENETTELFCGSNTVEVYIMALDSNATNLALTSSSCTINSVFTLTGTFDCVGDVNCSGSAFIDSISDLCTIQTNGSSTYNIQAGTSTSFISTYSCSLATNYAFDFNVSNIGDAELTTQLNVTCEQGGGLTDEESSCILTGKYVNGTDCAVGTLITGVNSMGTPLAILLMLGVINLVLFLLPKIVDKFSEDEILNMTIKYGLIIGGFYMLLFNGSIALTLADNVSLGISGELGTFLWFVSKVIYISILIFFVKYFLAVINIIKVRKYNKRMGIQ